MFNQKAICSWSGGKDSCFAYYKALQQGYKIEKLLNFISCDSKRACFHGIESNLMKLQAESIGIPLVQKEVTADMKKYEEEFKAAVCELMAENIDSMVFGDIYLLEHASWVERVCSEINIAPVEPLWNISAESIVNEFINLGFKAVVVSCQAEKLGKEFIGRVVDKELIAEFKRKNICPCGENGEFHTLVIDGPIFNKKIEITRAEPILKEGFWKHWFLDIKTYTAINKN